MHLTRGKKYNTTAGFANNVKHITVPVHNLRGINCILVCPVHESIVGYSKGLVNKLI